MDEQTNERVPPYSAALILLGHLVALILPLLLLGLLMWLGSRTF
jgi:hypothetical protein